MAVPDALSRDTMDPDVVLCHRFLEAVQAVTEDTASDGREAMLEPEEVRAAQERQYGAGGAILKGEDYVKDEDGVWCRNFGERDVRVVVPSELQAKVLQKVHGSKTRGHWGFCGRRRWYEQST
jgi:hypothetical protein